MVSLWTIDIALAAVSSAVLMALLGVHLRTYRRVATRFGLSLMVFIAILLAQNLFAIYSFFLMEGRGYQAGVALPLLVINASALTAYLVLLKITWE